MMKDERGRLPGELQRVMNLLKSILLQKSPKLRANTTTTILGWFGNIPTNPLTSDPEVIPRAETQHGIPKCL
jgi:hypothetical protein